MLRYLCCGGSSLLSHSYWFLYLGKTIIYVYLSAVTYAKIIRRPDIKSEPLEYPIDYTQFFRR